VRAGNVSRPDRIASQRSRSRTSLRVREPHLVDDFEILDVDVRLEEAVEEDQSIGPRFLQRRGKVRQRRVNRRQLDGDRNRQLLVKLN
jgi:hypothetical protein